MSGLGTVWGIAKLAATRIPWGRLVESAPAVVDLVGRAGERFRGGAPDDLLERVRLLQEENRNLERVLQQTADRLQELERRVQGMAARQRIITWATATALLAALCALLPRFFR